MRLAGARTRFDDSGVACTSTCASSLPTFAIATSAVEPRRAVTAGEVQSVAATGDPIESATPGVPAHRSCTRASAPATTEPTSVSTATATRVLAHRDVVDATITSRERRGDVDALQRVRA